MRSREAEFERKLAQTGLWQLPDLLQTLPDETARLARLCYAASPAGDWLDTPPEVFFSCAAHARYLRENVSWTRALPEPLFLAYVLHPTKYAEELVKKMEKSGAKAYLVNTGWNGTGKRISIKDTRGIIDAILDGAIKTAPTKKIPYFDFEVPTELTGVDTGILDPRDTYADPSQWEEKAKDLAQRFIKNFAKYEGNDAGKALVAAGPQL